MPQTIRDEFAEWARRFSCSSKFAVPRCLNGPFINPDSSVLYCFVDASTVAFFAVIYLRTVKDDQVHVSFVMAKSRVVPIRQLTVPRLELQAVTLGVTFSSAVANSLGLSDEEIVYWSETTTVITWLNSKTCKFQTWVGNRVAHVLEMTCAVQWRPMNTNHSVSYTA